CTTGGRLFAYW
nr:immunoglobulin heavy chain junction region [Mus musculus]